MATEAYNISLTSMMLGVFRLFAGARGVIQAFVSRNGYRAKLLDIFGCVHLLR